MNPEKDALVIESLIDIGANLSHESFAKDLNAALERAHLAQVHRIVITGACEASSIEAANIARRAPKRLFSTAGVHPHHANEWHARSDQAIERLIEGDEVVAIGETGLDFNRDFSPRAKQEYAFEAQLELAQSLGLPVFLHARDAFDRFIAILGQWRHRLSKAVIHCFTGNARELDACLDLDLHVGITGWICDERRGLHLREIIDRIPEDRLMIETDAPYLLPRDLDPAPDSRRNEPMHLPHILHRVAKSIQRPAAEVARATTGNAQDFFSLPELDPSENLHPIRLDPIHPESSTPSPSQSAARAPGDTRPHSGAPDR
ncbi:TatD family hydrolase [Thioalkalivibrio sp. HK1]|uniref:TatD family hydrolase n=1 Tax=Thioalkalivibrio sp. HK1 TaxID=1469245 RepID=UPI0009DDFC6A|nr:TatD family hydrolase [Thioalkalivibrio sp. HK1]